MSPDIPPAGTITSRKHPLVQRLREIRDSKDPSRLFVEGVSLAKELLSSSLTTTHFFYTKDFADGPPPPVFQKMIAEAKTPGALLSDDVMSYVSDLKTPPGLILLAERPSFRLEDLAKKNSPLLVLLDALQLPQNVGAVVRAAEAAGADGLVQTGEGTDPYGPKSLRGSAGSAFRLPIVHDIALAEATDALTRAGIRCVVAAAKGKTAYTDWDWKKPTAVLFGTESAANPKKQISEISETLPSLHIPMHSGVESLNVSVAAGIILFEARRQRRDADSHG
ncbi:MAG TPA: RNA methyltransferase [Elusimicrobiota bacterium]|nr:RNA methyltransferase [Elusimicrobiota bacterium]